MTFVGTRLENKSLLSFPCLTSYIRFLALKLKKWIGVLQEYSIIHNFLFMRYSYWKIKIFYLFLVLIYIYIRFLALKLKKGIGVFARIFDYPQFSIYAIFVLENKNLLSFPCSYIHLYMFFTFKTQEMVWCFARIFDYPQYSIIRYSNQWSKLYYACTYI